MFLLMSYETSLYILDTSCLLDMLFLPVCGFSFQSLNSVILILSLLTHEHNIFLYYLGLL